MLFRGSRSSISDHDAIGSSTISGHYELLAKSGRGDFGLPLVSHISIKPTIDRVDPANSAK